MRYQSYLRQRYLALLGYIGGVTAVVGVLHFIPILLIPFFPEEIIYAGSFALSGLLLVIPGILLWKCCCPPESLSLSVEEGSVVVVITWSIAILAGALPFIAVSNLSFSQAVFESTSGWTTTGLSVVDVEAAPKILLFYRSVIQLAGGAGFAILALSAVAGSFSAGLVSAEGRAEQLAPNVRHSANIVLRIYTGYIIIGILTLRLAGMDWFDAINHAFTALSTGGFSTHSKSIGFWDNPRIEAVILVLMVLGSTNFFVAYTLLRGKIGAALRSGELRLPAILLVSGSALLFSIVTGALYPTLAKSIRVAIFEVTSALTTTGFATVDYRAWPDFGWMLLILLMLIGGGTGSTAGGIKQLRIYILYRSILWEIERAFKPRHMVNEPAIWRGDKRELLNDHQVRQIALFIGFYISVFLIGSGLMAMYNYSMKESLFEFASTLGTVGLSVGVTAPDLPVPLLWAQSSAMLLGRLEFFTVIIGLLKIPVDITAMFRRS